MNNSLSFIFNGYESNFGKGEVLFHFGYRGEKNIDFAEKISFPPVKNEIPQILLMSILNNLMLILGISYWKVYCPRKIVIKNNFLTREQAEFWNTVYTKGLGEFFYKNKIDFRGLIKFPFVQQSSEKKAISFPRQKRYLVGVGGGKDSIVAAEILRKQNKDFDLLTLGWPIQEEVANAIGKKTITIKKELDPKLLDLNKQEGVYNGHIPISVVYGLLGVMAVAFYDYDNFVVGNEKSANFGNVEYLGQMINHQWSKSEEFEKLFNDYVKKFITPDITYSSPLRNTSELQVIREFVKYPKYFNFFSSCNRNFKIKNLHLGGVAKRHLRGGRMDSSEVWRKWCNKCPKCLFVFICLAAFLPKQEVANIFDKNLLEDKSLISLFEELIGVRNFKPFECVGTPEEVKEALSLIIKKGEFDNDFLIINYETKRTKK